MDFHLDASAEQCLVPAFCVQPLVENAIRYGMQTSPIPLRIDVNIQYRRGVLSIDVSNTGKWVLSAKQKFDDEDGHGASLGNIRKRLGLLYRGLYTLRHFEEDGRVHVKIRIRYDQALSDRKKRQKIAGIKPEKQPAA
jgi:LytS/YehU family sensor histidine kinase